MTIELIPDCVWESLRANSLCLEGRLHDDITAKCTVLLSDFR